MSLTRALRDAISGEVIFPGDIGYEQARRVWNGMIDCRPAAIARPRSAAEVAAAIGVARVEGMTVAVRGGAHNVAGNATCDGGLVIDLSAMRAIEVDGGARRARAQGGVTWGELDRATQAHGLASTGGLVSSTGIAGFTLGGGIGWLMRRHGLACDNLVAAEVVTAAGRTVRAAEDGDAELLWGLRGGGGNFGVVTEFEFRLHPVSAVLAGMLAWPAAAAPEVLRFWREWVATATDEVCTIAAWLWAPDDPSIPPALAGAQLFALSCVHLDPAGSGPVQLAPLRELHPAIDTVAVMPYTTLQTAFDPTAPYGVRTYWRSSYLDDISDATIATIGEFTPAVPAPLGQLHIHQLGGAVARVAPGATAVGHRDTPFLMNYFGLWHDAAEDERNIAWVRAASDAVAAHGYGARFVNFLADEGESGARSAYDAATWARLQALKRIYDPDNFFRLNQNVAPG